MLTTIFGSIAAKLSGLGVAAKVGLATATAATAATAAVVAPQVLPVDPGPSASTSVEVTVPDAVPNLDDLVPDAASGVVPNLDDLIPNLGDVVPELPDVAAEASAEGSANANQASDKAVGAPEDPGGEGYTGLDRARATPAGDHIPDFVPGPPNGTPGPPDLGDVIPDFAPVPDGIQPGGPPSWVPGPPSGVGPNR